MMSKKTNLNDRAHNDIGDTKVPDQDPKAPLQSDLQTHLSSIQEDIKN